VRFGVPLAGADLVVFAVTTVDQIIVGHLLGPIPLALYALALNLSSWPFNMFALPGDQRRPSSPEAPPRRWSDFFVAHDGFPQPSL
jgi:Polysaccharide biosynthesis protein